MCARRCGPGDLRCEGCRAHAHRKCLRLRRSAYPAGWFECTDCVLRAAGVGSGAAARRLAADWVAVASSAVAEGSAGVYETGRRRWVAFCGQVLHLSERRALPPGKRGDLNPHLVCMFLVHAARRLAFRTVQGNISALADWQRAKGRSSEDLISKHPLVARTMKQLRRNSGGAKQKAPLPVATLRSLINGLRVTARADTERAESCARDACWLAVGFFGMLRRSELAGLRICDITQRRPRGAVEVAVRRSKTDQQGAGESVHLAKCTRSGVAIGRIVDRYLGLRRAAGAAPEDPVFVRVGARPAAVGRAWFTERLRSLLLALWALQPAGRADVRNFSAHSLRRGGATAAANAGAPLEDIKIHGRWKSDAVLVYIRKSPKERRKMVSRM